MIGLAFAEPDKVTLQPLKEILETMIKDLYANQDRILAVDTKFVSKLMFFER